MALYYNNNYVNPANNVFINNQASNQLIYNNVAVWKRQLTLFYNGSFGGLGVPVKKYVEGSAWQNSSISGANWLINCDGRSDWWFPQTVSGYSSINITVAGREGAGQCFMFASTDTTDKWGVNAQYVREITTVGTYTLPITTASVWIGVEALRGGVYISNMWLS